MSKRLLFTLALSVSGASSLAAADPVTLWNTAAEKAFTPTQGAKPVGQSRTDAYIAGFADYPSAHALMGPAAAEILIELFGDRIRYETTSLMLPGVSRRFQGFADAAEENGDSRIFADIHFPHAVQDGQRQGRSIGTVVGKLLPAVGKARNNY